MTTLSFDGQTIVDEFDVAPVMFETGYPYIGMTKLYFDKFYSLISARVPYMNCTQGEHWGICRVEDKCENVNFNQDIAFTIGDYDFIIPLQNIAV